jgi:hypothetical protein
MTDTPEYVRMRPNRRYLLWLAVGMLAGWALLLALLPLIPGPPAPDYPDRTVTGTTTEVAP